MLWVKRLAFLLSCQCLLIAAQGPGPGPGKRKSSVMTQGLFGGGSTGASSMQSRAVDTRISLEVAEGLPSGTIVGSIPVKENFTYRFNEPPMEFSLDAYSGVIRTTTVLDRESFRSDRFDLVVLSSQPTYPIEVRIVVTDMNDNAPEFPEPSITVTFSESSAPGTRLLLDSAFDRDSGINGVLTYDIVAGNKDQKFRINVTSNPSGEMSYLHLETTGNLDRENRAFYHLNVSARDGGDPPLSGYLQVNVTILDVNDNPPMFDHSDYNVSMNESAPPGTSVLQVRATDNDIGDNAKITYYLEDIGRQFSIDPETGVISTTEPLQCVRQQNCSDISFSRKACPKSCVISVSAWDHGSPRQVGRAYVTVNLVEVNTNDHDPIINFTYFLRPAKFATVDENAVNGSVVAAVTVVDLDDGLNGETTVAITAGNELNHFRLDSTPAVRVNGVLDREEISKYNLTIVATDKGVPPRSSTASLIIFVNDVNDHEPVFEKSEYSVVLSELSPPGTFVAGITATDEDTGVNAQIYYAFVSGNERNWFDINTDSGLVTTKTTIDREVQGSVELKISARDGGPNPKWAYTHLKVTILDENDRKPVFSQNEINVTLSEDTPPNTLVAILTASDADQGTNGSVTYFLSTDSTPEKLEPFALDSLTGQLTTKSKLDREDTAKYEIRVIAKDQGIPPQSSTATVRLFLEDVNDNSPEFYPVKYFSSVSANAPVGHSILQVFARDEDEGKNAELRYSLATDREGPFQIDSKTGIISTVSTLKYTKDYVFKLDVSVQDLGGRKCSENAVVELIKDTYIQDVGFDVYGGYEFKIVEDDSRKTPSIKSVVGKIQIRSGDLDDKEEVSYYITEGDEKRIFVIDKSTGIITRNKAVDREEKEFYSLTCVARANFAYGKTRVNITVTDVNDNRPEFDRERVQVEVDENAPVGMEIFHASVQDKDFGPNSRFKYNLTSNPEDKFRINEATGVVYLNRKIHKNPGTHLTLEITVTDFGEPPLSAKQILTVAVRDVNDHTPVFEHTSYETSLLESTRVNDRFFRLSALDADLDLNGWVSYAITEGNAEENFGIFPDGYLYLKNSLDREDKDYYSLVVTATDKGEPPRSSSISVVVHVIDENDNRPEFTNSTFTFHILENEPPDTFVGKLTATDDDIGRNAELTFSFANTQNEFAVDPKNGFVKTLVVFDREGLKETTGRNFISVEAVVNDNGLNRLKDKATVNVYIDDVNDNPPIFLKTPYKVQVSEGSAVGTQLLRVHASDLDEGINGDVYYNLVAGNEEKKFSIEPGTGQIILIKELDREKTSRYMLTVLAEDGAVTGRMTASTMVVIDILDENDNAPKFTENQTLKVSVPETIPVNAKLTQFRATDADLGVNSEVVFSIGAGNRRETFHVDPTSGNLYLNKPLDYEELNSYSLTIVASDGGNPRLSSTALFNITVDDRNDNPPVFPNTALVRQILEGIPVNKAIVTVTAEDPDSGDNGRVTYSIVNQEPEMANGEMHFGINPTTGVIYTLLPIDREAVDTFLLTVMATDRAQPESARLSSEKLVTVIVEDVNDNAPIFTSMNAAVLPEVGTFIMHVHARDLDSNTNGLVKYDLVGGDVDMFNLDINSGALTLKNALVNLKPKYHLAVKATDEAVQAERKSTEAYITLFAKGVGNAGPKFASENVVGSISENEAPGRKILTVSAALPNAQVEYFVTNVTGNGKQVDSLFAVDAKTGVLSNAVTLDRETGPEFYMVEIYAIGANASRPSTSSLKVRVDVLDKNDSPPSFKNTQLEYSISEDLPTGHVVANIKAHDPDTIGNITYKLVGGGDDKFQMEPSTGKLRLNDTLDRETKDTYKLQIRASDGIQFAEATLKITVTDTNDNAPMFPEYAYSFDVPENTVRGTRVGEISASDDDEGANGQVTYQVISDWANDVFSLNPQSGVFTLTSRLDYEEMQHYIFVVQAQDGGKPSLSSTLTVYINVVDLNDNAPLFDPMSYNNEIFENVTVGTNVVTVSATDMDSGLNGKIAYSITGGDENEDLAIAQNGTIYTVKELDRERKSIYNLVVTGTDCAEPPQQKLSSTVQVSIVLKDVNDMSAEFITPNETTVLENIPLNTVVLAVKAIDKDEGRNGYLEYSIQDSSKTFGVGPVDGLVRVVGKLDRETRSNYSLEITAKDRGDPARFTKQTIFVNVLDENDNSPIFDPKHYSASIAENASIGASVLQVSATDIDEGPNGRVRYTIFEGDENRDFSISEDTGVVRVAKNLNFERKPRYLLTVRAEDSSNDHEDNIRYDTATISIIIRDINDNAPTFLDSPYIAYVMENTVPPPDGYVLTVQASDADTPQYNGQVRYFLKEGDAGLFRINASTGDISLLRALDRETQAEYSLTIVAMDTGTPPLTGSGTVKVVVQDVNDHTPAFERQSYTASILENSPIGSFVVNPSAKDLDSGLNAKIKYNFLGDKIERFTLDENTGVIRTAAILDREETSVYFFTFVAQDCSPTEPKLKAVNLTINVLDDNDNAPRFDLTEYTVIVPDNAEIGSFVFGAKARDDDIGRNGQIQYYLRGKDAGKFTIVPETGVVKTAAKLSGADSNNEDTYYLEVHAKDGGAEPKTASVKLRVQLKPVEWFPKITAPMENRFTLPENTVSGKVITKLSAESGKSEGKGGRIEYAIAGGNVDEALKVDPTTGEVAVAGSGKLDYETSPIYEVWVEAHYADNTALRRVVQILINVTDTNDNAPVVEQQIYNASIFEEEFPPQKVCTVKADDSDSDLNGKVSYRLVDDADGTFTINEETGEIVTETKLDREKTGSYFLVVEAVDHGSPRLTGSAVVLVTVIDKNDNPPRFTRLFSANVTENAEIGSFVIRVTSVDQDTGENANATYSFTENPGEKFSLDPFTGNVTVARPLDRETQDEYLLKVAAFDGAWRSETPLTITIQDQNDNAPEFEYSYYNFNFPEFQTNVAFVGQVVAVDRDKHGPNSVISYSLKHPSDLFTVDPATGELFSKRTLRYKHTTLESSPENQYVLTVLATDNGKPPMSSECLITVNVIDSNNNPPKFQKTRYFSPVPKVARSGQKILQVVAKDDTDYGINAEIEYVISGGNGTDFFQIDQKTGWIMTSRNVLPAEVATKYELTVRAVDKGVPPLEDETVVVLEVTGENLHTPVFPALSFQVIIPENDPVGSTMLTVVATDNDVGPNGLVEYEISSGNEDAKFSINSTTGALKILKPLDYDTVNMYHLNVTATDLGFKPRQATAMITIALTDVNDNPPRFAETEYHAYIPENSPVKTFVYQVTAQDIDSPKNAVIKYSIIRGTGKDVFSIDHKTGKIHSESPLDYEENDEYMLEVMAANPDSSMFTSTKIIVHVTGVNEYFPKFTRPVFHFEISESSEVGTSVGAIEASDADRGDDGRVYYLFVGSSNDKGFGIGSETGIITVSRRLDRETQNRVVLTVMAKNAGSIRGNDTDEAQVIISIQDGNDPPEFLQKEYQVKVLEDVRPGKVVLTVKAVDRDVRPQNNQFSYSIISGNPGNTFKIDPITGVIETTTELDRETMEMYNLVVGAIDVGTPPQTGTATVKILLEDVNDNEPTFDPPNVVGYVTENEPPNTSIMTLTATDPDLHPNGPPFTYYLVGGKDKDFVAVDKTTGVVTTTRRIDRETNPQLDIVVAVEDNGVPKMKSQHSVTIIVLDQNDSPSSPRTVRVLVNYYNDMVPVGKIADVHPNDPDTSGDYHCRIINPPASKNSLYIKHGCELTVGKVSPNTKYGLSVSGNDGVHSDAVSKVSVEFFQFTNSTLDNSFTVRVENMSSPSFLTHHYKSFLEVARTAFHPSDQIQLYSLNEADSGLELALAVRNTAVYYNKAKAIENLSRKWETLEKSLKSKVIVGFLPCQRVSCQNGGLCTDRIEVMDGTRIADSQTVIFSSPVVSHNYNCRCSDGFVGKRCDKKPDPCSPNPCQYGGVCKRQNFDFQCTCPPSREGKFCERQKGNACDGNPCRNGGTCRQNPDGTSYFCLCRPGYRGGQCEMVSDSCRPNPCLHGGICVSLKPGYKCSCIQGRYGRHCEKSTFGFNELSYMSFPPLDVSTNDITIIFATVKPNALLIYNYGTQTGGRSDFVALQLLGGKAVFSYGGARSAIMSVIVDPKNGSLADGSWQKVTATRNGRVMSLSVTPCTENGNSCEECKAGDPSCFADDIGPTGALNFNNHPMLVGGLPSTDPVLERPGQIHSDDFVGCVHSISVNGRTLNLSSPIASQNVDSVCGRTGSPCSGVGPSNEVLEEFNPCGVGRCLDRWKSHQCLCSDLVSTDCNQALKPITLLDGSFVEFKISEKHVRMQLLDGIYHGSTLWNQNHERYKRFAETKSNLGTLDGPSLSSAKSLSLLFRTVKKDGLILYSATNKDFTTVELQNGNIVYASRSGTSSPTVNMTVTDVMLSDGNWHNLTLYSHSRELRLLIDGRGAGEELDSDGVHDFLDPYLTTLSIGGARKDAFQPTDSVIRGFEGCIANFTINNEVQPFNGSGSVFSEAVSFGKILPGCAGPSGIGAATAPDPLSIGVTLVIVFFVTLLVAILVSFVVFHLRRQKKEKGGSPIGRGNLGGSKQNGGATMVAGERLVATADGVLGRGHHGESNLGYLTEATDMRGHHLVAPELISRKYKDRDMVGSEGQRHSRPDIIEREVVSKSPLLREEHSSLPSSQIQQNSHQHEGSEIPEHYDLENASSIAPSDTDIVYHYKGYRDGGLRKYKATPPHVPSSRGFHHKHSGTQQQHRHSPHMTGGFPPPSRDSPRSVVPPPPVSRVESPQSVVNSLGASTVNKILPHQSTPLARLSPSSELSSQQPRILTLSDISGKPLQSALLATTSSSGGVGKDILHSNSERSLNSPVMSQLSGQSSSASRKNQPPNENNAGNKNVAMGLTAEEIDRLNCHPRTSSLVSTLDVVSSSSEAPRARQGHHLISADNIPDNNSSTSTDESGNDSFTCSEIEYDNNSINGDKRSDILFSKLTEDEDGRGSRSNNSGTASKPPLPPPSYNGFDSSFRGSLSTLVASDDDLSTHVGGLLYRPPNGSPSSAAALGWDYLLNWGPNFESLVGVFKDIAELPDAVNSRVQTLRLPSQSPKPNEEYV